MMTRRRLPGVRRLKTTIGSLLSMQSEMAVASITLRPCSSTFRYEISANFVAVAIEHRIGRVDAVDLRALEDDVRLHLHRPQRGGGVGGEVGVAGAGGEDDDAAFFEVADGAPADERLGDGAHLDGRGHARGTPMCSSASCSASALITVASMPM